MSTWTCKTAVLAAGLILSACAPGGEVGLGIGGFGLSREAPERIRVAGESVVVAGPPGYCVDPSATRDGPGGAFVLMGSCASITRDAQDPRPTIPGLLTVTVSAADAGTLDFETMSQALSDFVRTDAGRAAISRSGRPESVEVLETRVIGGVLFIHARDTTGRAARSIDDEYWRAILGIGDRLVTASVVGFSSAPMSREAGLAVLNAFAETMRRENAS